MHTLRFAPHSALALLVLVVACSGNDEPLADSSTGGASPVAGSPGTGGTPTGGASSAGSPGTGGADGGAPAGLLIDDFEDGDHLSLLGSGWYVYDDGDNGGLSTITIAREGGNIAMVGEGFTGARSLAVDYTFDRGTLTYDPFVGFGTSLPLGGTYDLSAYAGLSYTYRGGAHEVRIETAEVTTWDYYAVQLPASTSWRTVTLPYTDFRQGGFGTAVPFVPASATAISWHVRGSTGATGSLLIDDVRVVTSVPGDTTPDMEIRPPSPPVDVVLSSIAVTNPLQARAMTYLDKGYNITNWLEQGAFTGFTYDEAYVAALAAAGFRALRLPIDLDLFVEQRTVDGTDVTLTVSDDLFLVLDSFEAWTAAHGLSLTIDYHQYDRSLDFADAATLAEAVELWSMVAEHFADNPREDLFFELLNEPELSVDGTAPTAEQWTTLANDMISAIRVHDTTHSIIFGDVEWYGIGALTTRTPFADPNVIYAFHFYDPFIFTHQGASWAGMGSTHDLPYPYSEARWSQFYGDFGFSELNETWQLTALRNYYASGNKSTLRNRVAQAKTWAVTHNVPIICNEFGAYDATSRMDDRARYYTDLADIFAELEIPWQIWFMLMDAETGAVAPEYVTAFGL